jgi:hypothetical protein
MRPVLTMIASTRLDTVSSEDFAVAELNAEFLLQGEHHVHVFQRNHASIALRELSRLSDSRGRSRGKHLQELVL